MHSNQLDQLENENSRLKRALEELKILNEIATAINSSMALNKIVELIVGKCIKHLQVEQAVVMLLEKDKEDNPFRTMIRRADMTMHTFNICMRRKFITDPLRIHGMASRTTKFRTFRILIDFYVSN